MALCQKHGQLAKPVAHLCHGARTHIDDLALRCSNCHRMIHRSRPWLTMLKLRQLLYGKEFYRGD